ncbi:hypothetical protein EV368DRAFT_85177 [Lentinula lateritia]|uniref:Uncharacterized protein n=1 Tax=Lentinula aff. lateritia TaxID=2804960 RepID=A0ACC1TQ60_9AGAR|nr:hypothetical protein F5876DRAFT_80278 [Lentinula aff. lateritia]KAJ3849796.1 hypothetical protein EV368DRAFT_85177 [Lentinula lateritia]
MLKKQQRLLLVAHTADELVSALIIHRRMDMGSTSGERSTDSLFNFESITGPVTPNEVITATVLGNPPPFRVVFSNSEDGALVTATPMITSYFPISAEPDRAGFSLTVPSLSAAEDVVYIEYISSGTPPVSVNTFPFPIGTVSVVAVVATSSDPGVDYTSTQMKTPTGSRSIDSSQTASLRASSTTTSSGGLSNDSSSATDFSSARTALPSPLSAEQIPKKSKIPGIIGGVIGLVVSILIAILLWNLYRRCHHRHRQDQRYSNPSSRPTSFHADMMVKTQATEFMTDQFGVIVRPRATVHRSRSMGSSRNSSIDNSNEKTPLETFSRPAIISGASSAYRDNVDDDDDGRSTLVSTIEEGEKGPSRLSPPRTDRQMELEQKIHELRLQMISLSSSHKEESEGGEESTESEDSDASLIHWHHIRARIKRLEQLEFSDWALGMTNQVPRDFIL